MKAPLPANEAQRLAALRGYDVLDTPPEQSFDDLTLLAAHICRTPIALVSLVDESRQWFKSKIGVSAAETSRDIAFCAHTILHQDEILEVRDAETDPRFADSLLVTADPHIRFYAGAPLVSPEGHALGALCVMDRAPRILSAEELAALRALSRHVVASLELRRQARELEADAVARQRSETLLRQQFDQLRANKMEGERHFALAEKSRRALLSVLEDEKRAKAELVWKTAFLEAQVDSDLDGILVVDGQGKIILKNQRLFQLFKIPDDLIHNDDDAKLLECATNRTKNPKQFQERVLYLYAHPDEIGRDEVELANGTILDRYSSPVRDKTGRYYGRIWTFRDITEQRKLEAQIRQAQKMEGVGQLAGGVAHDFNNILAVIQMQSDLIKGSSGLSSDQLAYAEEISATVERAAALTRQLLLFSRREVFQPRDLDLSESINNTTKMLRRVLGENINVQLKLASLPMCIRADAGMMDQVLLNLVVNARDAMPNGGQLVIETSAKEFDEFAASQSAQARIGSFVCLSVSDSGSGIPPEVLPKIFEPFFTTKDVGKGTGLGLATVLGIVQQHEGWVDVYSELGHGTTFRVYIPRLAKNAGPKTAQPAPTVMGAGSETILLAEDDPTLRASVRKILSQLGYRILEAPTGVKALEVWKQNRDEIRLLLTDLVMPDGMTGKDLAQRVLQDNPKLKVIYISGYSAEVVGKDFPLKEGLNFLTKPFQASKLVQTIRANLDPKI
jgi:signal transduction histidine kinase/GAF domain-containing protein/ActR/RegA family two-component response regulator